MNEQEILQILGKIGAVITDSHIVYTSGKHGRAYIDKDAVYPHTTETSRLCRALAEQFAGDNVEVVIGPTVGGVILSQWTAHHLAEIMGREVLAVYADKNRQLKPNGGYDNVITIRDTFRPIISGKRILTVDDVLTTGGSAKKVIEAVRAINGKVVSLGILCNRGGITPEDVANPPKLFALANVKLDAWDEAECTLCAQNVPINTDVGKGREYLARKKTS